MKVILFLLIINFVLKAQIKYEDYFYDKTMRIDYIHSGNKESEFYSLDEIIEEPYWGGSKTNLLEIFNYGNYKFEVVDDATGNVIYSRTYSTLFQEWQTTEEAKHLTRSYTESVVFPYPKKNVTVIFYSRERNNNLVKQFELKVDPNSYFVRKEQKQKFPKHEILNSGDPANKVDVVILPEGYTEEQMELFIKDCERVTGYLFNSSPFKENKNKFNIWAVLAPSKEEGTDIPAKNIWKNTLLNTNFYTFDIERYLMSPDYKSVRDVASNAPYDQIYILVNSNKYGGGAIYNYYNVCVREHPSVEYVFVHEFGHGFAYLADEYYTSDVAYQDYYPLDVEPLEANLTTLVDFDSKWKNLVEDGTPIPTPVEDKYKKSVGAFEGGGYVAKGVYRPRFDCTMKSISVDNFCPPCYGAIEKMINFYAE